MSAEFCFFHSRQPTQGVIKSTLNRRSLSIILKAIEEAWAQIDTFPYVKSHHFMSQHLQDEDELSTKLMEILNYRLDNDLSGSFNKNRFQTVVRDGKQSTATLSSFDQMPDLVIRPMKAALGEDRDESALFIEAKLVDKKSGCREYVVEGLHRFVSGRYAPRVTFGLMLGYSTRDFHGVDIHLPKYYKGASGPEAIACKAVILPSDIHTTCFETLHTRNTPSPPNFKALHIWLMRPQ